MCEDFLKTFIDIENAISLLDTSHMFNMSGLKSSSTKFISENTLTCLKIEKSEMVSADCLKSIMEIDKKKYQISKYLSYITIVNTHVVSSATIFRPSNRNFK
jgi:hypothetical protein